MKTSEVFLTCAQVIGAALALILSLSIIPAQRAAEAFSPAVLRLYAQDRSLVVAFAILSGTTTLSVLLGTNFLRFWIAQLAEIAHKFIARRDTSAANDIIAAMGKIGMQYSEARRNSLILLPDFDSLFMGGVSDIGHVLDPIYDRIHVTKTRQKLPTRLL